MADPFFRFQNKARAALSKYPNRRLQYVKGQGYRLVMKDGNQKSASAATKTQQGLPAYALPNRESIWTQAEQRTKAQYDPILQMIQERYERDRQESIARQQAQIAGADKAVAAARDPLANVYNSAIGQATQVEEAVSNRLKGVQGERGTDFAAKLAQMGAPETGALEELNKTYTGAGNARYASGMSDVGRLVSRGAEARAFLEKQPLMFRQQADAELAEALNELTRGMGDDRMEVMSNIPGQVEEMYRNLYGEAEGRSKDIYDDRWRRVEWIRQQRLDAMENQIAARELGDAKAERAWKTRQAELDRELEREMQQQQIPGVEGGMAGSAPPTHRFLEDGVTPNPNYVKPGSPGGKGGETAAQKRLRAQNARADIRRELLNPMSQQLRQAYKNYSAARLNGVINGILRSHQIDPFSPEGVAIRQSFLKNIGKWKKPAPKPGRRSGP